MDTNKRRDPRLEVTKQVMKFFAVSGQANDLPVQMENGHRPIIIAMPEDRISEVLHKVKAYGEANVCVVINGDLVALGFGKQSESSSQPGSRQPIHEDITMEMFVTGAKTLLESDENTTFSIRFGNSQGEVPSLRTLLLA